LQEMDEPEDDEDGDEDGDDDADREHSDDAFLLQVDEELEDGAEVDEHNIPKLTREDINLGRFSIHKVSY
jgi:hypothetical protein